MIKKKNYLNNKDMLREIHRSKTSYCQYDEFEHTWFDSIVMDIDEILFPETITNAKIARAARIADQNYREALEQEFTVKPKLSGYKFDPLTIEDTELVFRVITYEHIPLAPGRKKHPKTEADHKIRVNFIPFKHYIIEIDDNGNRTLKNVLISHFKDDEFSLTCGSMTNTLAKMYMLMVNRYSQRVNWRGYSYLEEMKGQSLVQLSQMGLQFNEAKSSNPFSYYTASIANSFTRVFNIEKRNQTIRDDLLVNAGMNPSSTRQLAIEEEIRKSREAALGI